MEQRGLALGKALALEQEQAAPLFLLALLVILASLLFSLSALSVLPLSLASLAF